MTTPAPPPRPHLDFNGDGGGEAPQATTPSAAERPALFDTCPVCKDSNSKAVRSVAANGKHSDLFTRTPKGVTHVCDKCWSLLLRHFGRKHPTHAKCSRGQSTGRCRRMLAKWSEAGFVLARGTGALPSRSARQAGTGERGRASSAAAAPRPAPAPQSRAAPANAAPRSRSRPRPQPRSQPRAAAVPAPTGTSRGCAACRLWLRRFFADSDGTPRSGFHRDCVVLLLRAAATAVGVDTPRRHSPDSLARLAESLSFDNLTSLVNSVSTSDLTDVPTADDGGGDGWASDHDSVADALKDFDLCGHQHADSATHEPDTRKRARYTEPETADIARKQRRTTSTRHETDSRTSTVTAAAATSSTVDRAAASCGGFMGVFGWGQTFGLHPDYGGSAVAAASAAPAPTGAHQAPTLHESLALDRVDRGSARAGAGAGDSSQPMYSYVGDNRFRALPDPDRDLLAVAMAQPSPASFGFDLK